MSVTSPTRDTVFATVFHARARSAPRVARDETTRHEEMPRARPATSSIHAGVQCVSCFMKRGGAPGCERVRRRIEHRHAGRRELGREARPRRGCAPARPPRRAAPVQLERLQARLVGTGNTHQPDPARRRGSARSRGPPAADRATPADRRRSPPRAAAPPCTSGSRNGGPPTRGDARRVEQPARRARSSPCCSRSRRSGSARACIARPQKLPRGRRLVELVLELADVLPRGRAAEEVEQHRFVAGAFGRG